MAEIVVLVCGISGVGKTTITSEVCSEISSHHMIASEIIARQKKIDEEISGIQDKSDLVRCNQEFLIKGFCREAPNIGNVFLDGHVVIDGDDGIKPIEARVFSRINVGCIVNIIGDPIEIHVRRQGDVLRARPQRSIEELASYQEESLRAASMIALTLNVPLIAITQKHKKMIAPFIQSIKI